MGEVGRRRSKPRAFITTWRERSSAAHFRIVTRPMEASRFERQVRTESSEIFAVYGGARRIGRVDLHYGRFEVNATLLLEVDLTDDELQQSSTRWTRSSCKRTTRSARTSL